MRLLKILVVLLLFVAFSRPVTGAARTTSQTDEPTISQFQPKMNAQIQVGNQESQIKFWRTNNTHERQVTIGGLTILVMIGLTAMWARRRFY